MASEILVGRNGLEPLTFRMSSGRSTAELTSRYFGLEDVGIFPQEKCPAAFFGETWKDRTSDIFRVKEALYR